MSAPNLRSAAAAVMGLTMALAPIAATPKANAQEVIQVSNQSNLTTVYDTSLSAGGSAAEFSSHPNSVGVVIYYGEGINPSEYGDVFARALIRRGVNAKSFAAPISGDGLAVLYQVGPSGIGPLGFNEAVERVDEAVELSHGRDSVLSADYTPAYITR